jgi:cytochrome P450
MEISALTADRGLATVQRMDARATVDDMGDAERNRIAALNFRFDRLPPGFHDNPYPIFAALQEHAPVHRLGELQILVTRYADCERIYKDAATFSSDKRREFAPKFGDSPLYLHHTSSLVFNDPPSHTRVRKAIVGALSPRAVIDLEPGVSALVDRLLDAMAGRDEIDVIEDFAGAIPIEVIGNLLGVPHVDRAPLRGWSLAILGALEPFPTSEQLTLGNAAVADFSAYLDGLISDRRRNPGDPDKDILTRLIRGDTDGGELTAVELVQNCIFILNAGHETTTNLIGNGLKLLADWPDDRARLLADPSLVLPAVEEILRFESSNQLGSRIATVPFALQGQAFSAGTQITLCIAAANRDPAVFPEPHRLDVTRLRNRHFAFGSGPHLCAGLSVARMEGRLAIARFVARFPRYALAGPAERSHRLRFRGFTRLPVRLRS